MNYIIIDDNQDFAELLCGKLNGNSNPITPENELGNTAKTIKGKINEDTVILININLKTGESTRQLQKGIELLKWLRLKECYNHCILYSFQNINQIIKPNPLNSILFSKGVTFIRAPFSIADIVAIPTTEPADKGNLLPYFRAEVDLVGIRHELANIWGVERLKWAIDHNYVTDKSNYKISLLGVLNNEKIAPNVSDLRDRLSKLKKWFQKNNPPIYYYDDMADTWGNVLKSVFGKNFKYIKPVKQSPKELIKYLSDERPKCLLLDLRLNNEKNHSLDPLKLSGGKLLVNIKKRCFSLPVIMFTATNKAESVRRLLAAGAEYVWTKEGIDDGIDDILTLQNTIDLLQKIKICFFKFKNPVYEDIYETETKISRVFNTDNDIKNVLQNGVLKDFKTIVFDTNSLLDGLKFKGALLRIHKILLANKTLDNSVRKKIIIHDDIYYELFRISKLNEQKNDDNDDFRVPASRYLIKLLYEWRKRGLLWVDDKLGQQAAIRKIVGFKELTPIEKIDIEVSSFFEKITELFNNRLKTEVGEVNKRIEQINAGIKSIPDLKKLRLHFDDTLKEIIPEYIKEGGVLLVTNDNTCAYNVGQLFEDSESLTKHTYNCKFNSNDKNDITEIEGVKSASVGGSKYTHMLNIEFAQIFLTTTKPVTPTPNAHPHRL